MQAETDREAGGGFEGAQTLVGRHVVDPARLAAYRSAAAAGAVCWLVAMCFVARDASVPSEGFRVALLVVCAALGVLQGRTLYLLHFHPLLAVEMTPGGFRYIEGETSVYVPFEAITSVALSHSFAPRPALIVRTEQRIYRFPWFLLD